MLLGRSAALAFALLSTACGGQAFIEGGEEGAVSLLATPQGAVADVIVVDDEIFWIQSQGGIGQDQGAVMRASIEPDAETTRFVGEGIALDPFALAQDDDRIYWCANETLSGCGLDEPTCPAPEVLAAETTCQDLVADDGQLYLLDRGGIGKVTRCLAPACDAFEPVFEGTPSPGTLTVDRGELFWSTNGSSSGAAMDTQVASCDADDCQSTLSKMAAGMFRAVVTDPSGDDIYFGGWELGAETSGIWSCTRPACESRATLYSSSGFVADVAVDDGRIYFVELHEEVLSGPYHWQASLSSCPKVGCGEAPTPLATAVTDAKSRVLVGERALVWLTGGVDGVFLHVPK